MNAEKYMLMAKEPQFMSKGSCLIHSEMTDGNLEQVVSGDGIAILYAVTKLIERLHELTEIEFEEAVLQLFEFHEIGKEVKRGKL